ncbi:hypothetical protein D3C80_1882050 [compost metagenome]
MAQRGKQRFCNRPFSRHQVKPKLIRQRDQWAHVTGVQQDSVQMLNGQMMIVVIRIGALQQADVGHTHI